MDHSHPGWASRDHGTRDAPERTREHDGGISRNGAAKSWAAREEVIAQNLRIAGRWLLLAAMSGWFFLPFFLVLRFGLPPYAFGHESIGYRFGLAWRWLNDG